MNLTLHTTKKSLIFLFTPFFLCNLPTWGTEVTFRSAPDLRENDIADGFFNKEVVKDGNTTYTQTNSQYMTLNGDTIQKGILQSKQIQSGNSVGTQIHHAYVKKCGGQITKVYNNGVHITSGNAVYTQNNYLQLGASIEKKNPYSGRGTFHLNETGEYQKQQNRSMIVEGCEVHLNAYPKENYAEVYVVLSFHNKSWRTAYHCTLAVDLLDQEGKTLFPVKSLQSEYIGLGKRDSTFRMPCPANTLQHLDQVKGHQITFSFQEEPIPFFDISPTYTRVFWGVIASVVVTLLGVGTWIGWWIKKRHTAKKKALKKEAPQAKKIAPKQAKKESLSTQLASL